MFAQAPFLNLIKFDFEKCKIKNETSFEEKNRSRQKAIELAEIYLHQALIIFRSPEAREFVDETHVNKLLEWIIHNWNNELFLKGDIRRSGPHCVRNLNKLEDAIEVLIARGDIICFKKKQSIYISLSWKKACLLTVSANGR